MLKKLHRTVQKWDGPVTVVASTGNDASRVHYGGDWLPISGRIKL